MATRSLKKAAAVLGIAMGLGVPAMAAAPAGERIGASAAADVEVVVVTDANRNLWYNTPISSGTDETYDPASRVWQGIPTIECSGDRLWAAWMAGGLTEPSDDNYIVVGYSDDGGETWTEPYFFLRNADEIRNCCPYLWLDPYGILRLYYVGNSTYEITITNPDGAIGEVQVSAPRRVNDFNFSNDPIVLNDGSWMVAAERTSIVDQVIILRSADKGETWTEYSRVQSVSNAKAFQEAEVVQLSNGDIWCLARIERGVGDGVERAVSTDNGKTWTTLEASVGYPFVSPGSKVDFVKLANGDLLFTTNASTSVRRDLTTYLSEDEGETWHELLIDARSTTSYPQSCEDADGNIYIIYDCNRGASQSNGNYPSMEIRVAKLTREQIGSGSYDMLTQNHVISKNDEWHEIVALENAQSVIEAREGSAAQDVLASLPAYLRVYLDDGTRLTLAGEWKAQNYSATQNWSVLFETALPENISDTYGVLTARVVYDGAAQPSVPGVNGALIGGIAGGVAGAAVIAAVVIVLVRKKKRNEKNREET